MAIIRPFNALRPRNELAEKIAALPYDVYNKEEAKEAVKGKAYSFLNIDRPETQFSKDMDMYDQAVYEKAAELLEKEEADGWFVHDEKECCYIYELTMNGRTQTGLVALSSVDDYLKDVIRKHENIRPEKELDRFHHINACSAQTGPIFLAYRSDHKIDEIIERRKKDDTEVDFVADDGIRHRVWKISDDKDIEALTERFAKMANTYIADGHHRTSSAVAVSLLRRREHPDYTGKEEFNYFMSVLFPSDELRIMAYNRLIKEITDLSDEALIEKISEKCIVEKTDQPCEPEKKGEIGFLLHDTWYRLTIRDEYRVDDPVEGLDVAFLQREILSPILGIKYPAVDKRIEFIGGIRGIHELERRCSKDAAAAFAMYPTHISELFDVADAGRLMPAKSTWFEPKLRSGLFIHKIER